MNKQVNKLHVCALEPSGADALAATHHIDRSKMRMMACMEGEDAQTVGMQRRKRCGACDLLPVRTT